MNPSTVSGQVLPDCKTVLLKLDAGVLHITFNRPEARNAMSSALLQDIDNVFDAIRDSRGVRAVVMRGAGGHFCAGGDIKDMASARMAQASAESDPVADYNRQFGRMLRKVNSAPQATVAVLEGAVLGGGFGLACVTDVAIAHKDASFGMPETGLGLPPAQIAPFVVERVGISQARRLGVCGARFNGEEALRLGLVHFVAADAAALDEQLAAVLKQIRRCAPIANAVTKEIMLSVGRMEMDAILDYAAGKFSEAVRGPEGAEGTTAFVQKRLPKWAE
jgi:isohexenylglutaconyl-CoA hydratase